MTMPRFAPIALVLLAGCSSAPEQPIATLADLPAFDVSVYQAKPKVGAAQLSELYQQILALQPGPQTRQQIRYRLSQMQTEHVQSADLPDASEREQLQQLVVQYEALLRDYPDDLNNELIRYQLARSYDLLGDTAQSLTQLNALITRYPDSEFAAEVWFRKADIHYSQQDFANALNAYQQVLAQKSVKLKQHALYMAGWCEFKLEQYANADRLFLQALDLTEPKYQHTRLAGADADDLKQQRLRAELLQILSVSLSYQQQASSLQQLIDSTPYRDGRVSSRPMQQIAELYQALADFLANKQLFAASYDTYRSVVKAYPQDAEAVQFQLKLIQTLLSRGEAEMALAEQRQLIVLFGPSSDYWRFARPAQLAELEPPLLQYLQYFASKAYHQAQTQTASPQATAKSSAKATSLFREAAADYAAMVHILQQQDTSAATASSASTTTRYNLADLQFLTAEALAQAGDDDQAIALYQQLAYGPAPAVAASLFQPQDAAYRQVEVASKSKRGDSTQADHTQTDSQHGDNPHKDSALFAIQQAFYQQFPAHPEALTVALSRLQQLFNAGEQSQALALADRMLHWPTPVSKAQQATQQQALYVQSQLQLQREDYAAAEQSLQQLLQAPRLEGANGSNVIDTKQLASQLASAVYQQAQRPAPVATQQALLTKLLQQPRSEFHEAAAWQQIELAEKEQVASLLRQFLTDYPRSERRLSAQAKLVALEDANQNFAAAAALYQQMADETADPRIEREALWNAATAAGKAKQGDTALTLWQRYVTKFPQPHDAAQEARYSQLLLLDAMPSLALGKNAVASKTKGSKKAKSSSPAQGNLQQSLYAQILQAEQLAAGAGTERTRFIAASAALNNAKQLAEQSRNVALTHPLKQSLGKKRSLMTSAISAFEQAMSLGDRSVVTAANYQIAELYRSLAKDLLASERPRGLDELALEQYNLLLEEQAYPFEEQAIAIYQKNLLLLQQDYVDEHVRQSLQRLAELVPAKYQRPEELPEVLNAPFN